jgi:orotidine-5'-phosphate decarboxylase
VTFGQRLASALQHHGPLCVGIDPSPALLDAWGLPYSAAGLGRFGTTMIDAMGGQAAVLKPQVAFWEAHGSAGYAVLEQFVALARDRGFLVLADAKRGDIGSTSEAYARAWLDPASPLSVDAVTVTAYLGLAALDPFLDLAFEHAKGVIVVARSSNPEGTAVQSATTADGPTVADHLLAEIAALNERTGHAPYGGVGAVVGGTTAAGGFDISRLGGPVLAPGFGAQGATAGDYPRLYGTCRPGTVLASVSRDILRAGPNPDRLAEAAATWQRNLRAAAGGTLGTPDLSGRGDEADHVDRVGRHEGAGVVPVLGVAGVRGVGD